MSTQTVPAPIEPIRFTDALSQRYLAYALSTITARSLPDVRDGLKPVQRRVLYAMLKLRLDPASGYKKCARVVGDVIGKYHPHGEGAIYDSLVRLAQDFAQRYPLVDGQGNFGNVDGDNAAAMRYTEARLSAFAQALLEGIDDNTVDFRPTYDGSDEEPVVLPAALPNLLANGTSGIAVGMATNIPPHNLGELCGALCHLLDHPDTPVERLAELLAARRLPLLADLRDESAEEVRLVLVPRSRAVPAELLMEQLFRETELEVRLSLNLNVLDGQGVPRVMGLVQVLNEFL